MHNCPFMVFTFIALKIHTFFLRNSQIYCNFAIDLRQRQKSATITIKLYPTMKLNGFTLKQQTQDFLLRLFIESDLGTTLPENRCYTCARCGTHARLHQ